MSKKTIVALVIGLVIGAVGTIVILSDDSSPVGASASPDHYVTQYLNAGYVAPSYSVSSTTATLTEDQFGKLIELDTASGTTVTLPATKAGAKLTFLVTTAFDTANIVIDSAEGDNIEGLLEVNAADVACSGEDQINFVNTAETVGDRVTLISGSANWYILDSAGDGAGSITCTDPS